MKLTTTKISPFKHHNLFQHCIFRNDIINIRTKKGKI